MEQSVSNIDDQYREMLNFRDTLIEFDLSLDRAMRDLQARHDSVSPLWQDEMRRHYDAQWKPLHDTLRHYVAVEGPSYVEFLSIKLYALERYLHGG